MDRACASHMTGLVPLGRETLPGRYPHQVSLALSEREATPWGEDCSRSGFVTALYQALG